MTARDDYPADGGVIGGTAELHDGKYEAMCDEIDRLRANAVVVRPGDTLIVNVGLGYGAAECLIFKQEIMERLPGVDALVVTAEQLLVYRP